MKLNPKRVFREYIKKYYYAPPSVVTLSGSTIPVKWRGTTNAWRAKEHPYLLKEGLYLLCSTGSWFGYYDGQTLHEHWGSRTPELSIYEDPNNTIFHAFRDGKKFLVEPVKD